MKKRQYEALAAIAIVIIGFWLAFLITDTTYGSSDDGGDVGVAAIPTRTGLWTNSKLDRLGTPTPSGTPVAYWLFLRSTTPRPSRTPSLTPTFAAPTSRNRGTGSDATATRPRKPTALPTKPAPTKMPKPTGTEIPPPTEPSPQSFVPIDLSTPGPAYAGDLDSPYSYGMASLQGSSADISSLTSSMSAGESSGYCESYPASIYCRLIVFLRQPAGGE